MNIFLIPRPGRLLRLRRGTKKDSENYFQCTIELVCTMKTNNEVGCFVLIVQETFKLQNFFSFFFRTSYTHVDVCIIMQVCIYMIWRRRRRDWRYCVDFNVLPTPIATYNLILMGIDGWAWLPNDANASALFFQLLKNYFEKTRSQRRNIIQRKSIIKDVFSVSLFLLLLHRYERKTRYVVTAGWNSLRKVFHIISCCCLCCWFVYNVVLKDASLGNDRMILLF